ncbi:hypothetical protein OG21DRAFT_1513159 [Imleria badia]|nr:hypothetical protein OG21DRAFT_1513159 [Imleria badia]
MALHEPTVAIAVIGVTGSGKSTFINLASGSNLPVGTSLRSCTTTMESSKFSLDGRTVMLIDTPGFDDATPSVLEVLKSISDHFSGLYSQGIKLAGVIYMHCITEDRMRDTSRHNFRMFSKFCGDTSLRDVLIVANKWPGNENNDGEARDQESPVNDEFFWPAIDKGARMLCHDGSQASAHAVVRHFLHRERTAPAAQGDSLGQQTDLSRTTTTDGDAVRELTGQVEHHTKTFEELCQGIDAATLAEDENTRKKLQAEAKNSLEKIERIRYDLEQMVTNFASENTRLEGENRQYKNNFTAQKEAAELRIRLLGEERRARELAEAERERAEAKLAEERALWERQKMEREGLKEHAGPKYDKLFACGALIIVLLCVSRFAFDGSP